MSEPKPVYKTQDKALPASAQLALRYRRCLRELRELTQSCTEIAEDRDAAILQIEKLQRRVEKLTKELEELRGKA
jgi:chromosome segregation ATPase